MKKYKKGDIVKIIVQIPDGVPDVESNRVKNEICSIKNITKDGDYTEIELSNGFFFGPEQIEKATPKEIEEKLREILAN